MLLVPGNLFGAATNYVIHGIIMFEYGVSDTEFFNLKV